MMRRNNDKKAKKAKCSVCVGRTTKTAALSRKKWMKEEKNELDRNLLRGILSSDMRVCLRFVACHKFACTICCLSACVLACLPACPAWPGQDSCSCSCSHIVVACMSHAWPSLRPCGSVRQYPPSAADSGPICGFWAAAISCLLPGQARPAQFGIKSSRSTRSKSDNCVLCAPLVWGVASSFACNRFTFKSWLCRTHKD